MISDEENFSMLELQLIRSSLSSRTDEEIAEILERPVEIIRRVINDMTGMAGQRQAEVMEQKRKEEEARKVKRRMAIRKAEDHQNNIEKEARNKRREAREQRKRNEDHRAQLKKEQTAMTRMYKTRVIDFSKLQSIRIDEKTTVFVEPGDDIEKVKRKYTTIRKKQTHGTSAIES